MGKARFAGVESEKSGQVESGKPDPRPHRLPSNPKHIVSKMGGVRLIKFTFIPAADFRLHGLSASASWT